ALFAPGIPQYHTLQADTFMDGTHTFDLNGSILNGITDGGSITLNTLLHAASTAPTAPLTVTGPCVDSSAPATCTPAVQVNGNETITGLLWAKSLYADYFIYNTSDARLKHDIKPIESPLEDLSKIRALSFSMNGSNEKKLGVIAQEVEKVYPELIQRLGNGYMSVDYFGLIGPLIGAVQELKAQNDVLKKTTEEQAKAIKQLQEQARRK
ncbi:MAG: tail fiber domain-containing protein, partial [Alphaproteobacteria bacterium]|nr:tail fiber domain-containing protein [Alphaproteobacteria bacterium]